MPIIFCFEFFLSDISILIAFNFFISLNLSLILKKVILAYKNYNLILEFYKKILFILLK